MTHLLVTNDFPPKVGGIQAYLWELWSRLDPAEFVVLTASSHPDAAAFDAEQAERGIRIKRMSHPVLLPTPGVVRRVRTVARRYDAGLVVLDPALPLGLIGPRLGLPYAVVLHGAEVAIPGRLPGGRQALAHVLRGASLAISAGGYPAAEGERAAGAQMPPVVNIPPGVDIDRFHPLDADERSAVRAELGVADEALLVVSVSRLVPRKGMDVLVEAAVRLRPSFPGMTVLIAGDGRERSRLAMQAATSGAPVRLIGRVADDELPRLLGAADVFVMACRNRWSGLEQEGFGIVFLEAAAAGIPQVAGRSGGADEAVVDGGTGLVVARPRDPGEVAGALRRLLADAALRRRLGEASRERAAVSFAYDLLAPRLATAIAKVGG